MALLLLRQLGVQVLILVRTTVEGGRLLYYVYL